MERDPVYRERRSEPAAFLGRVVRWSKFSHLFQCAVDPGEVHIPMSHQTTFLSWSFLIASLLQFFFFIHVPPLSKGRNWQACCLSRWSSETQNAGLSPPCTLLSSFLTCLSRRDSTFRPSPMGRRKSLLTMNSALPTKQITISLSLLPTSLTETRGWLEWGRGFKL